MAGDRKPVHRSADSDELRPVSALFADIVGSTGLGERLRPAEVKAVVGECVSRMCEAVEAHGGVVTGQMGDGIAAFFGLHGAREDDVERAARAALEIREAVLSFAHEVKRAWTVEDLAVRIGLNAGRAAIGPVGGKDETVVALGDAVNVAARLQASAQPGTIVVGPAVAAVLGDRFEIVRIDEIFVKGRVEPVEAYELRALVRTAVARPIARFVGRDREFTSARAVVDDLRTGRGQILTVVGDGGIGKSRVIAELRASLPSDVLWLDGACDPVDQRLPYEPFEQALRSFLSVAAGARPIEIRTKFRAVLGELLGTAYEEHAAHLARLLGVTLDRRSEAALDGLPREVLTLGLYRAYGEWLARLSATAPVVLAIDNFCDATEQSAGLLAALLEQVERHPLLLILALRPRPETHGWRTRVQALANHPHRCAEIGMSPLEVAAVRVIVDDLDPTRVLDAGVREEVVRRAEGNPLYVEQLVAMAGAGRLDATSLPSALESFLLARIDSLSGPARAVLQSAAVIGPTFPLDLVRDMAGGNDFEPCLNELLYANVVREHQRTPALYRFRHGLLRDAALSSLTPERLGRLHARAARSIQRAHDFDVDKDGERLAGHYLASGEAIDDPGSLEALADRLAKVYSYDHAIELYDRCREACDRSGDRPNMLRVLAKQADLFAVRGEPERCIELIERCLGAATEDDSDDTFELRLALATRLAETDRLGEARSLLERCVSAAPDDHLRVRALYLLGLTALNELDIERADECLRTIRSSPPGVVGAFGFEIASLHGGILARAGNLDRAERWALEAAAIAATLGRRVDELTARRRVGIVQMLQGYVKKAAATLLEVYESYARLGFVSGQAETAMGLLSASLFSGDLEVAARVGDEVFALAAGWRNAIAPSLAEVLVDKGEVARARTLAEAILSDGENAPPEARSGAQATLVNVLIMESEWTRAESVLKHAIEDRETDAPPDRWRVVAEVNLCELALHTGNFLAAVAWAESAAHREVSEVPTLTTANRALGSALAAVGERKGAELLARTLKDARKMGMRLEEARCLVGLGVFCDGGKEALAEARQIFTECGSKLGLRYADSLEAVAASAIFT